MDTWPERDHVGASKRIQRTTDPPEYEVRDCFVAKSVYPKAKRGTSRNDR